MAWKVELTGKAKRHLDKLDKTIAWRILNLLDERLAQLEDRRSIGEALKGSELGQFWKYRVGDYRITASIEGRKVTILIVAIGNRREVYR
jgi:mRNA interferase RelE/StbE